MLWDVCSKVVVQRLRAAHDGVCFWVDVRGDLLVTAGQDGRIKVYRHQGSDSHVNGSHANGVANGHKTPNGNKDSPNHHDAMEVDTRNVQDQELDAEVQAQILGQTDSPAEECRDTKMEGTDDQGSASRDRSAVVGSATNGRSPGGAGTPLQDEDVKQED